MIIVRSVAVIVVMAITTAACSEGFSPGDVPPARETESAFTSTTSTVTPAATSAATTSSVAATVTTTSASTTIAAVDELEDSPLSPETLTIVRAISRFVERERGLDFKEEVEVRLLSEEDFIDEYTEDNDESERDTSGHSEEGDGFATSEAVLGALGLLEDLAEESTLEAEYEEYTELAILGFYDPEGDVLVIRTEELTAHARGVLAHELTHALDDQWFDIHRPDIDEEEGDEAPFAFRALVEGDARRIEDAYLASRSKEEQVAAEEESDSIGEDIDETEIPFVLIALLAAPYVYGQVFVEELLRIGGQRLLDEAFEDPPITSEQILNPQAYRNAITPEVVPLPPADGDVLDSGVIGQHLMFLMLGEPLGYEEAIHPVRGWAGDAYVAWTTEEGSTCVRIDVAADGVAEFDSLERILRRWVVSQPDARLDGRFGGILRVTACQ